MYVILCKFIILLVFAFYVFVSEFLVLDTSDVLVSTLELGKTFADAFSEDEGFQLRHPLRKDVYGDLFLVIYSCAYKSTPIL